MKKVTFLVALAIGLGAAGAHAVNLKSIVMGAEEIVNLLKRGKASSAALVTVEGWGFGSKVTKNALLGIIKGQSGKDVALLVSREKGVSMDILKITLATHLDDSIVKQIDMGGSMYMHNSLGAAYDGIAATGVKEDGMGVMTALLNTRLVTMPEEGLGRFIDVLDTARSSGVQVSTPNTIVMDRTWARDHGGVVRNVDLSFAKNVDGIGPAATFEIRLGIPPSASNEQIRRVLEAAANGVVVPF